MDWCPSIAFALCLVAFSCILLCLYKHFFWDPSSISLSLLRAGLPVLPYSPVIGSVAHLKRVRDAVASVVLQSPSDHDIAPLALPFYSRTHLQIGIPFVYWWGTQPRLVVCDPDDIKQILSTKFKDYKKSDVTSKFLSRILGIGLLTSEGEDWHNQRQIIRHAFFQEKLNGMVDIMASCALKMMKEWQNIVEKEGGQAELEVAHHIKDTMADIIARTSFGSSYEKGKAVFEKQAELVELMMQDVVANSTIPGYKYIPTPMNLRCWKLERIIENELKEIVEARRRAANTPRSSSPSSSTVPEGEVSVFDENAGKILRLEKDLLGWMLPSEEQVDRLGMMKLNTRQVVDECKTFFFAGYETTSHLLAWSVVLLAHYSDWQERSRQEVLHLHMEEGQPLSSHHLSKLKIVILVPYFMKFYASTHLFQS
ncbi:hypothetical protein KP509_25G061300 [Ceratopteris richardii]|uniref:Cytochrome P450 n=1 Tax=Ceratopteris richardii TaxID=49495 RepID=A0A8T2RQZ4_CERRI|nr:hypothetical protein KP509_25G061300 [Ceratopteris richardii]